MNLPLDSFMKLSVINTYLRDHYASLEDFCKAGDIDMEQLIEEMSRVDYAYNPETNRFE